MQTLTGIFTRCLLAHLTNLGLASNQMVDPGVTSLAGAISQGALAKLTTVNLGLNQIGYPGMLALVGSLRSLPELRELKVFENRVGDAGIKAFAEAVAGGGTMGRLQMLYLHKNRLSHAGLVALAGAMGTLPSIRDLIIDSGPLGTEHRQLKAACRRRGIELR